MYAGGKPHNLKVPCIEVLRLAATRWGQFMTNAEVLQEIAHRYRATRNWETGRRVFPSFVALMRGRIAPVLANDVVDAVRLAQESESIATRDFVHAAVMLRMSVTRIVSTDRDFDRINGIERLDPRDVGVWGREMAG